MKRLLILITALMLALSLPAQNSKKVKGMKQQKTTMQKNIKKNEKALKANKQEQQERKRQIDVIERKIQTRVAHIHTLEGRIDTVERDVKNLKRQLDSLTRVLNHKKSRYTQALRYARTQRMQLSPVTFVLAGNTPMEMVRRARYAKEYATYQRQMGESVMTQRSQALTLQHKLLLKKDEMNNLLQEIISQRKKLNDDREHQQKVLKGLVKTEKDIDKKLQQQRKEMADLERKIEERIAYEIEQARRKAEAERKRREAEAAKKAKTSKSSGGKGKTQATTPSAPAKTNSTPSAWMTSEDKALSGSFESNKGRLPVPITGNYMITRRFGKYTPEGMKGVVLDNKGVHYAGQSGARARSIYDGVVTAIVDAGGRKHVLIRHGAYISAYINLSSVIVTQGQKVRARDLIGAVAQDASGSHTLQFQLRRERTLLNPASWIGR
ncbi:MAG: peptidoglycan DD-metalloendopeptidase family protein [Bacteroidaceae bacterium]|nr:peptidoglycan DD-metalloendopeptidase family protein [Bacteroidaceae bacterium]